MTGFQFCFFALLIILGFTGIFKRAFEVVCEKIKSGEAGKSFSLDVLKIKFFGGVFVRVLLLLLFYAFVEHRFTYAACVVAAIYVLEFFYEKFKEMKFLKKIEQEKVLAESLK